MKVDWDSILSYNTNKVVNIKDKILGILYYLILLGVFIYILVFVILLEKQYLIYDKPIGTMYFGFISPDTSDPEINQAITQAQNTYCVQPGAYCVSLSQNEVGISEFTNRPFIYTSIQEVATWRVCNRTGCNITAYFDAYDDPTVLEYDQIESCSQCYEGEDATGWMSPSEANAYIQTTYNVSAGLYDAPIAYVEAAEYFSLDIQHSAVARRFDNKQDAMTSTDECTGKSLEESRVLLTTEYRGVSTSMKGAWQLNQKSGKDFNNKKDYDKIDCGTRTFLVQDFLDHIVSQDDPIFLDNRTAASNRTYRQDGMVLQILVQYENSYELKAVSQFRYKYIVSELAGVKNQLYRQGYIDTTYPLQKKTSYILSGIEFNFVQDGAVGKFDFQTFLLMLVSSIGFLALGRFLIDTVATRVLPRRKLYAEVMNEEVEFTQEAGRLSVHRTNSALELQNRNSKSNIDPEVPKDSY